MTMSIPPTMLLRYIGDICFSPSPESNACINPRVRIDARQDAPDDQLCQIGHMIQKGYHPDDMLPFTWNDPETAVSITYLPNGADYDEQITIHSEWDGKTFTYWIAKRSSTEIVFSGGELIEDDATTGHVTRHDLPGFRVVLGPDGGYKAYPI